MATDELPKDILRKKEGIKPPESNNPKAVESIFHPEPSSETPEDRVRRSLKALEIAARPATSISNPLVISREDQEIVTSSADLTKEQLDKNYFPGFGVFPTGDIDGSFYKQVWTRDGVQAFINHFAAANPQAVIDSLETILRHQSSNGMLPLRVERTFALLRYVLPKPIKKFSETVFRLVKGRGAERPVYENVDMSGGEDTIPAFVIAAGDFFMTSEKGVAFVDAHYDQFKKAMDFFRTKTDSSDGLAIIKNNNADWADSIIRKGKLGNINILWARSLRMMEFMARRLGHTEDADAYREEFRKVKESVIAKLYNKEEGYFRAKEGEDRIDTVASIGGSLFLVDSNEAVRIEETLEKRVRCITGLRNFDPPYPLDQISAIPRYFDKGRYHNYYVWPWVACQNIQVKIRIALEHADNGVKERYRNSAVTDLIGMAHQIKEIGAVEIADPKEVKRATHSQRNFMGTMAAFQGAYRQLKHLGWI